MGFSLFVVSFSVFNEISAFYYPQYSYKDLKLCGVRLLTLLKFEVSYIFISPNSIIFKVTSVLSSTIIIFLHSIAVPVLNSDEIFTQSKDLQALNSEPHHLGAEKRGGGMLVGWHGWPGILGKCEQVRRKCSVLQRSSPPTGSPVIFSLLRWKKACSIILSSLCMCTTFRPAAVIPSGITMCSRHDEGKRERDVVGGVLVWESKGEITRKGKGRQGENYIKENIR